ncbi:MAG: hypothetical protein KAI40_10980 [Desulfobacterales bacterium]|nr:hypothetical protein [Desulfobacterales bacterium]
MKRVIWLTIIIMLSLTITAFSWGNKNATGSITSINHNRGSVPFVSVEGNTEGGSLWLGFSFKCGNGGWEHRKPVKVKGDFNEQFTMSMCPQGYSQIRACLWKGQSGGLMKDRVDCMDE